MDIRPYRHSDKNDVIGLLKSNTPNFFDPNEEEDLRIYLDKEIEDYFVVEEKQKIIGSGGINYFPEERTARFSWDIINPDSQGKGIGSQLIEYRLNHLQQNKDVDLIIVRTTQLVYKFYEKMGFNLTKVERNFWAKGFDLYQLKLKI